MNKEAKIYVAGHRGMVGSAIFRKLKREGYDNIVVRTHHELDLKNQAAVAEFFEREKPDYVVLAAARVGGIHANNVYRAEFIYDNLIIEANVIHQSYLSKVKKLLFSGIVVYLSKTGTSTVEGGISSFRVPGIHQ